MHFVIESSIIKSRKHIFTTSSVNSADATGDAAGYVTGSGYAAGDAAGYVTGYAAGDAAGYVTGDAAGGSVLAECWRYVEPQR